MKTLKKLLETRSSSDYKYTVKNDQAGHDKIRDTRRLSKLHNLAASTFGKKQRLRVDVRGRLGKDNPERWRYGKYTGPLHRNSSQRIKPQHSQRHDVYVRRKDRPWHD